MAAWWVVNTSLLDFGFSPILALDNVVSVEMIPTGPWEVQGDEPGLMSFCCPQEKDLVCTASGPQRMGDTGSKPRPNLRLAVKANQGQARLAGT